MPGAPLSIRVAAVGVGIHAINHIIVNLVPPVGWNVGTIYHLIGAPLYAALILPLLRGRNWARIAITVLLASQFAGRFVVWILFPTSGVHLALIAGWTITLIALTAMWAPQPARAHFRRTPSGDTSSTAAAIET
ncbi:hypothetical protein [Nocardia mexicana]|uniref:Uncharacterized protein n=1 Tax=Nocardia mexicana TaxID=279262 RepID=A0A370GT81_9NOCA|nr:hypothetical protein [Nocardia mexicana]RDI46701.1 hypothetical protein DFR68_110106 [Nocardia mexicana]